MQLVDLDQSAPLEILPDQPVVSPWRHGFTPLSPFVHASYASSLIEAAKVRITGPSNPTVPFYLRMARKHLVRVLQSLTSEVETRGILSTHANLGPLEPEALLQRPERVHCTLCQALHGSIARMY